MKLSVIITTYNRSNILLKVLEAYSRQSYPRKDFEIIIIDDGSVENTKEKIKKFLSKRVKYFRQENKGPSSARNNGLQRASGEYVLITGDDIIPTKDFLREHMRIHDEQKEVAVLGQTQWASWIKQSEISQIFTPFEYSIIKDKDNCNFTLFYTSNISLEKKWFVSEKFDENLRVYEDTEIGYRLMKKGLRIVYNPNALAYHDHEYDNLSRFLKRQMMFGEAAARFYARFPELRGLLVTKHKKIKFPVYVLLIKTRLIKLIEVINKNLAWKILSSYNYIKGFNSYVD